MKLLRVRVLQQAPILLGAVSGFTISVFIFGFLMDLDTADSLQALYAVKLLQVLLNLLGVGILILGTTKSTETLVRLRDCDIIEELEAVKLASFWYTVAGFGLGMVVYYTIIL